MTTYWSFIPEKDLLQDTEEHVSSGLNFQIKMSILPKVINRFNMVTTKITNHLLKRSIKFTVTNKGALITRSNNDHREGSPQSWSK